MVSIISLGQMLADVKSTYKLSKNDSTKEVIENKLHDLLGQIYVVMNEEKERIKKRRKG